MKRLVLLLFTCLTVSCTTSQVQQNPPTTTSKGYKTASYTVRGKTYRPMSVEQALSHSEEGYASYYGKNSKRVKTSLGEVINPQTSFSAAHKTLPLPCKVKVTCLKTGKSAVVRVNNRGPFIKNRSLDVTAKVAKEIGLVGRGIGKVKVEVISVGDGIYERKAS